MEWNLKGGCWDLTELDEAALHNIDSNNSNNNNNNNNNGSSRFGLAKNTSKREFCVDLKLGHHHQIQVVNHSGTTTTEESSKTTASSTGNSSSLKRARGMSNGGQTASCLVDGCNSDLSNCREYHRRHKVCEIHSKTPVVTIRGHNQRFCQQCSRFHSLEEFDEGKRSCRKRLDGHNRRRRKPQPLLPSSSPTPTFFSNYQALPSSSSHHHVYGSDGWDGRFQQVHKQHELFLGSSSAPRSQNAVVEAPCALSLLSSPMAMTLVQPLGLTLHHHDSLVNNNGSTHHDNHHCHPTSIYDMPKSHHASSPHSLPFHWD